MHPLVASYSIAADIARQYIALNKDYISGWHDR
jgi:alpha-galactosidase/6-phospho-beta-glucosidase family protein